MWKGSSIVFFSKLFVGYPWFVREEDVILLDFITTSLIHPPHNHFFFFQKIFWKRLFCFPSQHHPLPHPQPHPCLHKLWKFYKSQERGRFWNFHFKSLVLWLVCSEWIDWAAKIKLKQFKIRIKIDSSILTIARPRVVTHYLINISKT